MESFVQMTRPLLFLSSLCWAERGKEKEKNSKGTCKKLPMTKGQRVGGNKEHTRLREPEISIPGRLQVIKRGKLNSYDTERRENQWDKGLMGNKEFAQNSGVMKEG